jgi:hypothetical protein
VAVAQIDDDACDEILAGQPRGAPSHGYARPSHPAEHVTVLDASGPSGFADASGEALVTSWTGTQGYTTVFGDGQMSVLALFGYSVAYDPAARAVLVRGVIGARWWPRRGGSALGCS